MRAIHFMTDGPFAVVIREGLTASPGEAARSGRAHREPAVLTETRRRATSLRPLEPNNDEGRPQRGALRRTAGRRRRRRGRYLTSTEAPASSSSCLSLSA